ncbi:enhancer of polycomb homolog 1-like isoform X2 [Pseudochaenichthys georgianus]|uniref:enhancer of polycomb homolog 1-like isoform X2 n=1 Tax=Pseudochaenichthys georgianus TaxID=52239 RepID=UPI00146E18DF|nr:enhancer of polycomb homolog 1-like isoform X2 [Pseudochaenichthys georgianus]
MSKLSFRARALDASKPLPVFRCEDLPDLHEYASINRAVPQMPTGMEKEEESEHHLQRAISAQQVYGEKRDNMVIPVPEAERNITHYDSLYPGEFKMPKQLIHIQPFSLDAEQPDYDLDSEDETFVNKLKKKMEITALQFEEMIDRLEKGSGQQLVSLQEAKLLLKEDDELIKEVFDYWSRKRKTCTGGSLIPTCKGEKRDGSSTSDPYVAFRRRTEKMQTRKNRKNDEASYEKMLKLRRDLSRAVTILEMIKRREKSKRELLHLTLEIVEKRNVMPDYGSEVMAEALAQRALVKPVYTIPIIPPSNSNQYRHQDHLDMKDYKKPEKTEAIRTKRKYEKKPKIPPLSAPQHSGPSVFNPKDLNQYDFPSSDEEPFSQIHSGSSEAEEENDPDGCYAFRRKAGCQYYASRPEQSGSWPWVSPSDGGLGDSRFRYCLTSLNVPRRCIGLARRRMGRGGRVLLDRAHTELDAVCQSLDSDPEPEPLSPPLPRSPLRNSNGSTSETNTSHPTSSSHPPASSSPAPMDLSQIILNIKSSRWRHFRPRTLSHHPSGGGDLSRRGFRDFSRTVSALTRTLSGGTNSRTRPGPPPPPHQRVHSGAVPAAPGAAGPHAETAAGAEPTAASQQPCSPNTQHTGSRVQDVGPGQRSVCCVGAHHHQPAAHLQVQRGAGSGGRGQRGHGGGRCFQGLASLRPPRRPPPDHPVSPHPPLHGPRLPAALLQLGVPGRPHLPHLHLHPWRPRSSRAGDSGMQRRQRHPRHHSGPHREQHLSERAPHPPDPRPRAILCLKAVSLHQPDHAQSLRGGGHGAGLEG